MSISFNNASSGNADDGPLTFSHTVNAGDDRILIVGVCIETDGALRTVTGITFDGIDLTQIATLEYKADDNRVDLWYLLNPPVKTANVVVTLSGVLYSPGGVCAGAITINGAKQQAPEANASNSGTGTDEGVDITTITDNAWVIDVVSNNSSTNDQIPDGGQTERYEDANDQRINGSTKPVASASLTHMGWISGISREWGMIAASFEEAAAAPGEKNVSDSGAGSDAIAGLKAFLSISESGSGIEALLGLFEKLVPDTGLGADGISVAPQGIEKLVSDSGSGIESILGLYQKLIADIGSGIESIFGPPIPPFYKELFIKRVSYRISSQGIKCDLELGELYLPLEQEILNILRDLKNEKELLQANIKQLSV